MQEIVGIKGVGQILESEEAIGIELIKLAEAGTHMHRLEVLGTQLGFPWLVGEGSQALDSKLTLLQ